jgi:hypothetical protein
MIIQAKPNINPNAVVISKAFHLVERLGLPVLCLQQVLVSLPDAALRLADSAYHRFGGLHHKNFLVGGKRNDGVGSFLDKFYEILVDEKNVGLVYSRNLYHSFNPYQYYR